MKGTQITLDIKTTIPFGENHVIIVHTGSEVKRTEFWTGWWVDQNRGVHNNIRNFDVEEAIRTHKEMCERIRNKINEMLAAVTSSLDLLIAAEMHTPTWQSEIPILEKEVSDGQ